MAKHLGSEIEKLKKHILSLSGLVEENLHEAVHAFESGDAVLAERVIGADKKIDQVEVDIEEECLKILALHQPVAIDLRFIVSVLKINNDLERIGDLAVNVAKRATMLKKDAAAILSVDFHVMAECVQRMLRNSLDALVNMDAGLARSVMKQDDQVDEMHKGTYRAVLDALHGNPANIDDVLPALSVSRHLERIADHATNICEDVVYMVEGEIVRHGASRIP